VVLLVVGIGAYMVIPRNGTAPAVEVARATETSATATPTPVVAASPAIEPDEGAQDPNPLPEVADVETAPTYSPGLVRDEFGDWQLSCDTPAGASFEQCALIQNVTAEDQPNVGLSVIIYKTADQQVRMLRVVAPLGVLLVGQSLNGRMVGGLGLNVDGTDVGRVQFIRCLPQGCVAEVPMDEGLIKTLSEGQSAIFVVFKTPEEGVGIPVSLNGFGTGLAQLP
jgi:invasion protein IalB